MAAAPAPGRAQGHCHGGACVRDGGSPARHVVVFGHLHSVGRSRAVIVVGGGGARSSAGWRPAAVVATRHQAGHRANARSRAEPLATVYVGVRRPVVPLCRRFRLTNACGPGLADLLRPRVIKDAGNTTIQTQILQERETLLQFRTDFASSKAFQRKPRSLLMYPTPVAPFNDLMATSALNGNIQFWSYSKRRYPPSDTEAMGALNGGTMADGLAHEGGPLKCVRLVAELRGDLLHPKWPEDLCWVGGGVGLAACYPENADERRQASLIYFNAHVEV